MNRLNLLPPEMKEEINYAKKNTRLVSKLTLMLSVCLVLIVFFVVLGIVLKEQENVAKVEKEFSEKLVQDKSQVEKNASDLSDRLILIKKLKTERTDWDTIFKKISDNTPAGLQLQSIQVTNDAKTRATISGIALSDRDVVLFKDLLSNSGLFKYVDIESITENGKAASGATQKLFVLTFTIAGVK
jgi:Tfp pilus assembly protein PilN